MQSGRSTPLQWRSLSLLLGRHRDVTGSIHLTRLKVLLSTLKKNIDDIRSATAGIPQPVVCSRATSSLDTFQSFAEADVRRIIMSSPIKSCSLDPVPTFLLREFVDLLLPFATRMVNASLEEGRLPISQRHAIVTPLLKRPGLDTADMSNYRPVSNLGFMSKVVERAVAIRLNDYLAGDHLLPHHQSAYRKKRSTEAAMLCVWSDVLMAADTRQVTLLCLLDLSAAFDCVDHDLLQPPPATT